MGLFDPQWAKFQPIAQMHLEGKQIAELESLRKQWDIPHDTFALLLGGSPGFTKLTYEKEVIVLKKRFPRALPKQILALAYKRRIMMSSPEFNQNVAATQFNPSLRERLKAEWDKEEQEALQHPDDIEALRTVNTIDGLVWCTLEATGYFKDNPDTYGIMDKINSILGLRERNR